VCKQHELHHATTTPTTGAIQSGIRSETCGKTRKQCSCIIPLLPTGKEAVQENSGHSCASRSQVADDSPFRAREVNAGKNAVTLARDMLALDQETFSAAFRKSPMKRATLRGMKRIAAVALGNTGTPDDAAVLTRARDDDEPLVRDHAAWQLRTLRSTNS